MRAPDFETPPEEVLGTDGRPLAFGEGVRCIGPEQIDDLRAAVTRVLQGRLPAVVLLLTSPEAAEPQAASAGFTSGELAVLERALPAASRARLAAFTHPKRRAQSFAARLAAGLLASCAAQNLAKNTPAGREALEFAEEPPYGPVLRRGAELVAWLTLAHTAGGAAASLSLKPMGIDLERPRPVKRLAGVASFVFGDAAARRLKDAQLRLPVERFEDIFFALWGAKESEIKMNRTPQPMALHPRAAMALESSGSGTGRPAQLFIRTPEGRPLCVRFYRSGALRLTVLEPETRTSEAAPVFALTGGSAAFWREALLGLRASLREPGAPDEAALFLNNGLQP